jgi:hypothetical protein
MAWQSDGSMERIGTADLGYASIEWTNRLLERGLRLTRRYLRKPHRPITVCGTGRDRFLLILIFEAMACNFACCVFLKFAVVDRKPN